MGRATIKAMNGHELFLFVHPRLNFNSSTCTVNPPTTRYRSLSWHYFPRMQPSAVRQLSSDLFSVWCGNSSKRSSSKASIRRMGPKRECRCSRFS
ncbi:hypothetical protein TNCV_2430021 [Trichonephila clavipes]|nr:hypothetical protein TNCV_2430021 [Trichonephila clavipes]